MTNTNSNERISWSRARDLTAELQRRIDKHDPRGAPVREPAAKKPWQPDPAVADQAKQAADYVRSRVNAPKKDFGPNGDARGNGVIGAVRPDPEFTPENILAERKGVFHMTVEDHYGERD